jgi:hypothetical protein
MSDFEDDIDDQLLELAGATEKKKKKRQPSNSNGTSNTAGGSGGAGGGGKKRKAEYASFIRFNSILPGVAIKPLAEERPLLFWKPIRLGNTADSWSFLKSFQTDGN